MSGEVKGNKMEKTVVVEVRRKVKRPRYQKYVMRKTKVYAHSEDPLEVGTRVVVEEAGPISKLKRWRVVEVVSSEK